MIRARNLCASALLADAAVMAYRAEPVATGTPLPFEALSRHWTAYPDKEGNLLVMDADAAVVLVVKRSAMAT